MKLLVNGRIVEEQEAVISVFDHGFLYGMGLFETFRTYGGKPFLLEAHAQRLGGGCRELGIDWSPDPERMEREVAALLRENSLVDAYIRYTVSGGAEALGLPGGSYARPTVVVYIKPLPALPAELYERGRPLQLLRLRRNTPEGGIRLKSFHYMNNILAKRELGEYPWAAAAEGLLLSEQGHVAEGIVSNVFWIREGVCYTPAIETGILPGITRAHVMGLAREQGLKTAEGRYVWDELRSAEEVFLTNSIQEIVPVTTLFETDGEKRTVGDGRIGPGTGRLLGSYRKGCGTGHAAY